MICKRHEMRLTVRFVCLLVVCYLAGAAGGLSVCMCMEWVCVCVCVYSGRLSRPSCDAVANERH